MMSAVNWKDQPYVNVSHMLHAAEDDLFLLFPLFKSLSLLGKIAASGEMSHTQLYELYIR